MISTRVISGFPVRQSQLQLFGVFLGVFFLTFANTCKTFQHFFCVIIINCYCLAPIMAPLNTGRCFSWCETQALYVAHNRSDRTSVNDLTVACLCEACVIYTALTYLTDYDKGQKKNNLNINKLPVFEKFKTLARHFYYSLLMFSHRHTSINIRTVIYFPTFSFIFSFINQQIFI